MKKGLADTSAPGAFGRDQCYFTGAVKLLQLRRHIDFVKLHAAKVSVEEIGRVADKIIIAGGSQPALVHAGRACLPQVFGSS